MNKKVEIFYNIGRSVFRSIYLLVLKLRPWLVKILPESIKVRVRSFEGKIIRSVYTPKIIINCPIDDKLHADCKLGINLIGYSHAEMGIGESCRLAANAIQTVGIPFGIINYTVGNPAKMDDLSWKHKEIETPIYKTNIFHLNANQIPEVYIHLGEGFFKGHFNIGFWHWELPDFPDEWRDSFKLIQEVWVPSTFVFDSVSKKSPVPVIRIPHGIQVKCPQGIKRDFFRLPQDSFLFLSMYDAYSFQERKNPQAVIEAFKLAFDKEDMSVGLVLKVINAKRTPSETKKLKEKIQGNNNIYLINEFLSRNVVNALINSIDCFVSLHRSEGFGLGLAEAMYLGKPVIGTNWSGNVDFMNEMNSYVVDYKINKVGNDYGPYKAYQVWADPDVEQAANFMRKLVSDRNWREMIALKGQETIRNNFSPKVVGEMIKQRLVELGLL